MKHRGFEHATRSHPDNDRFSHDGRKGASPDASTGVGAPQLRVISTCGDDGARKALAFVIRIVSAAHKFELRNFFEPPKGIRNLRV
jgi:hypothetical protein